MHPPPRPTDPPTGPRPDPSYDFRRFGRHRIRTPNGAIIELPVPVTPSAGAWVATIWPDPHSAGGWARQLWQREPTGRGWVLPLELAGCDVVEFGADTTQKPVRWYGVLNSYEVDRWTTIQGPYPHPADAWNDAQRLLASVRFEPADAEPTVQPTAVKASRYRPGRCHRHRPIRRQRGSNQI